MLSKPLFVKIFPLGLLIFFWSICICFSATITVNPGGNIQSAINSAGNGDVIELTNGTYNTSLDGFVNHNLDTKGKAITIKSVNGSDNCVIDCNMMGRAFLIQTGEGSNTIIDDLTILNGYSSNPIWPPYEPNKFTWFIPDFNDAEMDGFGGSILCKGTSPTISNCIIRYSQAEGFGGAIFVNGGKPNIVDCNIMDNWALGSGGGIAIYDSNATVTDCNVSFNEAWLDDDFVIQHGGGIYIRGAAPKVTDCNILENNSCWSGGGIGYVWDVNDINTISEGVTITNCRILDNDSWASGGGVFVSSDANELSFTGGGAVAQEPNAVNCYLINCLIANNWASWSGGVGALYNSLVDVNQCTVAYNVVPWSGWYGQDRVGGIEAYFADVRITNSILWGNKSFQLAGVFDNNNVTYSDIMMKNLNGEVITDPLVVWPGEGNINADPLFVNPLQRDYRVVEDVNNAGYESAIVMTAMILEVAATESSSSTEFSPCINAGNPFSDVGAEPMPNGGRVNMGAYGGTAAAGKSDIKRPVPADMDKDLKVDWLDYAVFANNWLLEGEQIVDNQADMNNDGIVNYYDLMIYQKFWLYQQ